MNPLVAAFLILIALKFTLWQDMSLWILFSPFWMPLLVQFLTGMYDQIDKGP